MVSQHQIKVLSTSSIKPNPQVESIIAQIYLTPWDLELIHMQHNQHGLLFHKPNINHNNNNNNSNNNSSSLVHSLKASLEKALHFFPLLTGRIANDTSEDGSSLHFYIECKNQRTDHYALFIHASIEADTNLTVSNILRASRVPEIVRSFFPETNISNEGGFTNPLLVVQVTELFDGVFIGCSMNHMLGDGTLFWHFFNMWAEISCKHLLHSHDVTFDNVISRRPFLERDLLTLELTGSKSIYIHKKHIINPRRNSNINFPSLKDRVFHFSQESMAKLKARANNEIISCNEGIEISSLQAIIALVWRSIIRCRFSMNPSIIEDGQKTTFEIPIGARQRLKRPSALPQEYFGNAVFPGIVTLETKRVLQNGLGWAALEINKMVGSWNEPEKIEELYLSWIRNPNLLDLMGLPSNHFVLIDSPRFDVYGNDFGWGKPVAVRSGRANAFDGRITVSSGGNGVGSMEIEMCLSRETLCALEDDEEFMSYVCM